MYKTYHWRRLLSIILYRVALFHLCTSPRDYLSLFLLVSLVYSFVAPLSCGRVLYLGLLPVSWSFLLSPLSVSRRREFT
jgi:hypothetical protein